MPLALAVTYLVATGVSSYQQYQAGQAAASDAKAAANSAAATTQATADYNARVDRADEEHVALDATANIRAMRRDASVYLSRQTAAFAASGVMADTGSPLAVRVATAGQLALREQEVQRQANVRMQRLESGAQAGIAEGQSQADAYRIEGQAKADAYHREATGALLSGASKMIGGVAGLYNMGAFASAPNTSAGLDTYGGGSVPGPV